VTTISYWLAVNEEQVNQTFSSIEKAYRGSDYTFGLVLVVLAFVALLAFVAHHN
jgi:hypothetical protein